MASENGAVENGATAVAPQENVSTSRVPADSKGKGKAVATEENAPRDTKIDEMDEDDDDEDDEEDGEENGDAEGEEEEDDMGEIDLDNVIGRRTRGRVIDFAKAAAEQKIDVNEDEDDEDDDFVEPDDKMDED